MSSNLYWAPIMREKTHWLDCRLKWALQRRFMSPVDMEMDSSHLPYLQGLVDGGLKEARPLIDAIEKHDHIHVMEQC